MKFHEIDNTFDLELHRAQRLELRSQTKLSQFVSDCKKELLVEQHRHDDLDLDLSEIPLGSVYTDPIIITKAEALYTKTIDAAADFKKNTLFALERKQEKQ